MVNFFQYYSRVRGIRGGFIGLPSWARLIVGVFALPGILLIGLSLLLFLVSIFALLLLTVPIFRVLTAVTGGRTRAVESNPIESLFNPDPSPGSKRVDVRVVE